MASVEGFCQYFNVKQVNSFCVLPLYHVSGLMQFLRSFTTGGQLVVLPFRAVEAGDRSPVNPEAFFLSLVPTQLQRLLEAEGRRQEVTLLTPQAKQESMTLEGGRRQEAGFDVSVQPDVGSNQASFHPSSLIPHPSSLIPPSPLPWLPRFHTILLGGAPAWSDLLEQARYHRLRLAPTYGMTETASQIATLKPDDFLNGHTNAGRVLPHAQITICNASGDVLSPYQIGNVTIQASSLAIGYHPPIAPSPHTPHPTPHTPHLTPHTSHLTLHPDDLGYFDADGYLYIVGRQSDKIITGGENVFPAEVEAAIRSTGLVQDVCVVGVNDRHWGQAIAAVYRPTHASLLAITIQTALVTKLSKFKQPKHWFAVDQLPRNAQGKVNRLQVTAIAVERLDQSLE